MFHDPYNEELSWPRPVAYLLVDTGLPCMTSAFAVLFLALLRATQIELVSPSFQVKLFCNYCNRCCQSMSLFGSVLSVHSLREKFSHEITKCSYVDTGLPCMILAFAVLFLALLRTTQIELVSLLFQVKPFCNYCNWCCHSMSFLAAYCLCIVYVKNFSSEITKCNYVDIGLACMIVACTPAI